LEEQLSLRRQILLNALGELEKIVNKSGLYIGDRWRLSANDDYFFVQDELGGGFYRFATLTGTVDVEVKSSILI
jgi:hypothetical protein